MKCACIYVKWKQENRTPSLRAYIHSLYNLQQQYNFEFTLGRSYIKLYVMCKCMFPHIYLHCMQLWTHKHTLHIRNSQDNHSSHPLLPTLIPHLILWVQSTGHSTLFHIRACTLLCIYIVSHHRNIYFRTIWNVHTAMTAGATLNEFYMVTWKMRYNIIQWGGALSRCCIE